MTTRIGRRLRGDRRWLIMFGLALSAPHPSVAASVILPALAAAEPVRAYGMGGAGIALGADAAMVWSNPAAGAGLSGPALMFGGALGGEDTTTGKISIAWPVLGVAVTGGVAGYSGGSIDLESTDGTVRTVRARQEWVGLIGLAGPLPLGATGGISLKSVSSELLGEFRAQSLLADTGIQFRIAGPLKVGIAIRDAGSSLTYLSEAVPPPTRVVAGAVAGFRFPAVAGRNPWMDQLIAAADFIYTPSGRRPMVRAGLEARWFNAIGIRAGTGVIADGSLVAAAGLVFRHDRYRIEYGLEVGARGDTRPHMFSLSVDL